jgi:hypothetical protein
MRETARPEGVVGPVDFWALARFAANFFSVIRIIKNDLRGECRVGANGVDAKWKESIRCKGLMRIWLGD